MAQMIVTLCDLCGDDETPRSVADQAGTPHVVALGRDADPVIVDLCPDHAARLIAPLQDALAEHGRRLPAPDGAPTTKAGGKARGPYKPRTDRPGAFVCLVCGHRIGTDSGLNQHLSRVHNLTGTGDAYGPDHACPLCPQTFGGTTLLAQHAAPAHDVAGQGAVHLLWSTAIDQGDPTGAVAKRRAELGAIGLDMSRDLSPLTPADA